MVETSNVQPSVTDKPKVKVEISLKDSILKFGNNISLNIKLTNTGSTIQTLLFNKPIISTRGPWATSATVINSKTGKTALKYQNKAVLSSQVYSEEQLKSSYYNLIPKQTIAENYDLSDIVVFNSTDNKLPIGSYVIQLSYHGNISNSLTLIIK